MFNLLYDFSLVNRHSLRLKHADTFSGFSPIFVKKSHTFIPCSNSQFLMVKRAKLIFNRHFPPLRHEA
jgi:hypothetical protein